MNKFIASLGLASLCFITVSCDGDGLFPFRSTRQIRCTVGVADTRSLPITTDGSATNGTQSPLSIRNIGFTMNAYADEAYHDNETNTDYSAGKYFGKTVSYSGGNWTIADDPVWLNDVNLRFFSWAPSSPAGTLAINKDDTDCNNAQMPFTYTAAAPSVSTDPMTTASTSDLIFAYNSQKVAYNTSGTKTSGNEEVSIKFNHAMAQIRFCLSTDDGTFGKSIKLISVKVKNEPVGGSCEFNGDGTLSAGTLFSWTPSTTKGDFLQTFTNAIFPGPPASGTEVIPTGWVKSSYTKNSNTYNLYTCTGDILFLVPQKNFTGKKVDVTIQEGTDDPITLTASIPDGSWEAGKYYSYKIKAMKTLSLTLLKGDWIDGSEDLEF